MPENKLRIAVAYAGVNAEYQDKISRGILNAAKQKGYDTAFFCPLSNTTSHSLHDSGEEKIFDLINFEKFSALIVLPETIPTQEALDRILARAHQSGVPVISVDRKISGCHSVDIDYCGELAELVEHLITKHGFTEINYVGAYENDLEKDKRFSVYRKVLSEHGIPYEKKRVCFSGFDEYKAVTKIREYVQQCSKLPQAFVCANDNIAMGISDELSRAGVKVPEDVAVTGFGGIRFSSAHCPSITTVEIDFMAAGESAVNIIPEVLKLGKGEFMHVQIKNRLSLSESCGCVTFGDDKHNAMMRDINSDNDRFKTMSKRLIRMSEDLTYVNNFEAAFQKLRYYIEDIYVDRFYLCLNTHVENNDEKQQVDHSDYTDTIDCRIAREKGDYLPNFTFSRGEMLPALFAKNAFANVFFITPLHFQDRNFGYIALSCDGYIGSSVIFNTWKMNISTALENIRVRSKLTLYSSMLERMYVRDPLTNLYNRRGALGKAAEQFEAAKSRGKMVFVLAVDLDDLKVINDKYGHHEGDNAIVQVGNALSRVSKHREICARFGGDEFEVMAFNYSEKIAEEYVAAVQNMLDGYNKVSGKPYSIGASCGYIVDVPKENDTLEDFIRRADAIMYETKKRRKRGRTQTEQ